MLPTIGDSREQDLEDLQILLEIFSCTMVLAHKMAFMSSVISHPCAVHSGSDLYRAEPSRRLECDCSWEDTFSLGELAFLA